jgi:transposase InsO family protein
VTADVQLLADEMKTSGMDHSMSRRGTCCDNAVADSTIGSIKPEFFRAPATRHSRCSAATVRVYRLPLHNTDEELQLMAAAQVA